MVLVWLGWGWDDNDVGDRCGVNLRRVLGTSFCLPLSFSMVFDSLGE